MPGSYASGFHTVELDGVEVVVSSEPTTLRDGSNILRSSASVVRVTTATASFTLVNSDHFVNMHQALVTMESSQLHTVDGLLGQTARQGWTVQHTAAFEQHIELDYMLPAGDDELWSTAFAYNQYKVVASAS